MGNEEAEGALVGIAEGISPEEFAFDREGDETVSAHSGSLPFRAEHPHLWGVKRPDTTYPTGPDDEVTPELIGHDADMDQADPGNAGDGASPFGGDFTGGYPTPIQDPPDVPADILPDRIEQWPEQEAAEIEEEDNLTAKPSEPPPIDPTRYP